MPEFVISHLDLLKAVTSIKDKLSNTPECIPPYFIKRIIHSISYPLLILFNFSIRHNSVPSQWKESIITPIFKKGDKRNPTNYCPIALTSSFCRILETIISTKILDHLLINQLLLPNQFGFLPNRSSTGQLLWCIDKWYKSYCSGDVQYVTYTDISKAFDTVSHSKLSVVLKSFGINENLLEWIKNFLSDRLQMVRINSTLSPPLPILSGVPQGSVLGPLLFIIFINDIVQQVQSVNNVNFALFADDTKIFSTNDDELQSSITHFSSVVNKYQLKLAPQKCFILPICKKRKQPLNPPNFLIDTTVLSHEHTAKDLGIYISSNLKWKTHIDKISWTAPSNKKFFNQKYMDSYKTL